jgi:peptidoglycan/xylan/chitin deacetylase (PgdA/CDA1 family)/SAM-dependent methyltransferase
MRTSDALLRQDGPPLEVSVIVPSSRAVPLLDSVVHRLGAQVLESDQATGINAAVSSARGDNVVIVPAGWGLRPTCLSRCVAELDANPDVAAVAPSVRVQTGDGVRGQDRRPCGPTPGTILADPHAVPEVLMIRRSAWEALGGRDENLSMLGELDLWLRLAFQRSVQILGEALVVRDLDFDVAAAADEPAFLAAFRMVIEKHRSAIEQEMTDIFVAQETRFGRLRAEHAQLIERRDRDLAELDRVRAAAAHGRAFLVHHGLSALDWGDLRRTSPLSRDWGYDRGGPIDRRDIEAFLAAHSSDIHGVVLEVQEEDFTRAFGGPRVTSSHVLDVDTSNPRATVLADLRYAPELQTGQLDAIILTQTLHVIDDMASALRECHRALRPGGVLLATLPAASRVCLEYGEDGDLWRVTPAGARALTSSVFGPAGVECHAFGNVLTNVAFLHGAGAGELADVEYETVDPYYPALTGIRARKAPSSRPARSAVRGTVLLYHRIHDDPDAHGLSVSPATFAAQMAWLSTNCHVMPLDELLSMPIEALPEAAVAVTFDDGYMDTQTRGLPILQEHGIPATFFLTTRWLEQSGEYWWDMLERTLLGSADVPPDLDVPTADGPLRFDTSTSDARAAAHRELHERLVHSTLADRDRISAALQAWSGGGPGSYRPMVADEVHALATTPGVTIGAHTVNHLALPDQSLEVQRREVAESREALSQLLGRAVTLFAHPYGAIDRGSAALVRGSCRWGMSCDERMLGESFDAARVPRLDVKQWTAQELEARIGKLVNEGAERRKC